MSCRHISLPSVTSILICAVCVLVFSPGLRADLAKWDFEDGTLQGWTVVSGDAGKQPSGNADDRWGGDSGKQGNTSSGPTRD